MKVLITCMRKGGWLIVVIVGAWLLAAGTARAAEVNVTCAKKLTDAATLNAAISHSNVGDEISIHGTCLINETVVLLGDRSYRGDSRTGTVIQQAGGANLAAMLASDSWNSDSIGTGDPIHIAHLTLDGNKAANAGTSALVIRSWLTVIEDLQVESAPADGIQITNLSKNNVALQSSQVNGRISNCFVTGSGANGIHVLDTNNSVTDWDLLDSWIANSGASAIMMDNAAGWKVRGNHLYAVGQNGIWANNCFATAIDGNYIEDFGDARGGGETWYGIACTVQGGAASVITGNKIFHLTPEPGNNTFIYIGLTQVNYGTGVVNVVDNAIRGIANINNIGLSYQLGGGVGLVVLSASNDVVSVGSARIVAAGVTLANAW